MRFVSLDLLYGRPPDAEIYATCCENGMTKGEFDWFMGFDAPGYQVLGLDYYGRNERLLKPDGTVIPAEDVLGWYQLARQYYRRYRRPLMHTETNVFDKEAAPGWLWKQWINVLRLRGDGIPVLGFTWYSLVDQIDWDTELREKNDRVVNCGLYDLDRRPNPVAAGLPRPARRIRRHRPRAPRRIPDADRRAGGGRRGAVTDRGVVHPVAASAAADSASSPQRSMPLPLRRAASAARACTSGATRSVIVPG